MYIRGMQQLPAMQTFVCSTIVRPVAEVHHAACTALAAKQCFRISKVEEQGCHCCWQGAPSVSAEDLLKVHLHAHFPEAASSQS